MSTSFQLIPQIADARTSVVLPISDQDVDKEKHAEPSRWLNRGSEELCSYFRCGRFFTVGHEWYVTTREGEDMGPYLYRVEAEIALVKFVADCFLSSDDGIDELYMRGENEMTPFESLVREVVICLEQRHLRSDNSAYVWIMQRLERVTEGLQDNNIQARILERLLSEMDETPEETDLETALENSFIA